MKRYDVVEKVHEDEISPRLHDEQLPNGKFVKYEDIENLLNLCINTVKYNCSMDDVKKNFKSELKKLGIKVNIEA